MIMKSRDRHACTNTTSLSHCAVFHLCRGDCHPCVQSMHRAGDSNCRRLFRAGHRPDAQVRNRRLIREGLCGFSFAVGESGGSRESGPFV